MSCNPYLLGNLIRLTVDFESLDGVPTNPTTVTLAIRLPDNTTVTVTPTNDSIGKYHYDYTPTLVGSYYYSFAGTGVITAKTQGQFSMEAAVV